MVRAVLCRLKRARKKSTAPTRQIRMVAESRVPSSFALGMSAPRVKSFMLKGTYTAMKGSLPSLRAMEPDFCFRMSALSRSRAGPLLPARSFSNPPRIRACGSVQRPSG